MVRFLFPLLVVAVLVVVAWWLLSSSRGNAQHTSELRARLAAVVDVAYAHDELSPALAGAVIERTARLRSDAHPDDLENALADVLAIARAHRASEPDLAVIVIDTARSGPAQLG